MSDSQKQVLTLAFIASFAILLCVGVIAGAVYLANQVGEGIDPSPLPPDPDDGVLITAVVPNSPAALANLQPGHIIVRLDDQLITSSDLLRLILTNMPAGTEFNLLVRDEAGELRQTTAVRAAEPPYLGVEVSDLPLETPNPIPANATATAPLATELPIVSGIVPDSPAASLDVQIGDVITAVDGQVVLNGEELLSQMANKTPGTSVTLTLRRGAETLTRTAVLAPHPDDPQRGYLGIHFQP